MRENQYEGTIHIFLQVRKEMIKKGFVRRFTMNIINLSVLRRISS